MPVVIHEVITETVDAHIEFPGRDGHNPATYVMDFDPDSRPEVARFYRSAVDFRMYGSSMRTRSSVLVRVLRRLDTPGSVRVRLSDQGSFAKAAHSVNATYRTSCGETHHFAVEDLLILADIIEDRAILVPA